MRSPPFLPAVALLAFCNAGFDPAPDGKQLSIVEASFPGLSAGIIAADTVRAGAVPVRFHSFGSSSCNRPAGEDVAIRARTATITAYDVAVPADAACTADFGAMRRDLTLTLTPGSWTVRLRGVKLGPGRPEVELSKRMVVLP